MKLTSRQATTINNRIMSSLFDSIPKKGREDQVPVQVYIPKKLHEEVSEILKDRHITLSAFIRSILQRARDETMQRIK